MNVFQQTLLDLERTQQMLKKQLRVFFYMLVDKLQYIKNYPYYRYEEEISRLRQQLDQMQHNGYQPSQQPDIKPSQPPPAPPPLTASPLTSVPHFGPPPSQQQPQGQPPLSNRPKSVLPPPPPPSSSVSQVNQPNIGLNDLDPESVPANMKVEGQDWFAL